MPPAPDLTDALIMPGSKPLSLCLLADSEPVRAAVRIACLPPTTVTCNPFAGLLEADNSLSEAGRALIAAAGAADALLVGYSLDQAPLIALLCHEVRRSATGRRFVPVIALCGGSQEDVIGAWAAGVDDVIHFPIYLPLLRARIAAHGRSAAAVRRATSRRLKRKLEAHRPRDPHAAPMAPAAVGPPGDGRGGVPVSRVAVSAAPPDGHRLEAFVEEMIDEVGAELVILPHADQPCQVGPLRLDQAAYRFLIDDEEVELTPKEFDLLFYLMGRCGEACTRDEILDAVWGIDFDTGTNMVDGYIYFLRKKLDVHGLKGMIKTVRGRGYRLEAV